MAKQCEHCQDTISEDLECPYNRLTDELKDWLKTRDTSPAQYCFSVQISRGVAIYDEDADQDR